MARCATATSSSKIIEQEAVEATPTSTPRHANSEVLLSLSSMPGESFVSTAYQAKPGDTESSSFVSVQPCEAPPPTATPFPSAGVTPAGTAHISPTNNDLLTPIRIIPPPPPPSSPALHPSSPIPPPIPPPPSSSPPLPLLLASTSPPPPSPVLLSSPNSSSLTLRLSPPSLRQGSVEGSPPSKAPSSPSLQEVPRIPNYYKEMLFLADDPADPLSSPTSSIYDNATPPPIPAPSSSPPPQPPPPPPLSSRRTSQSSSSSSLCSNRSSLRLPEKGRLLPPATRLNDLQRQDDLHRAQAHKHCKHDLQHSPSSQHGLPPYQHKLARRLSSDLQQSVPLQQSGGDLQHIQSQRHVQLRSHQHSPVYSNLTPIVSYIEANKSENFTTSFSSSPAEPPSGYSTLGTRRRRSKPSQFATLQRIRTTQAPPSTSSSSSDLPHYDHVRYASDGRIPPHYARVGPAPPAHDAHQQQENSGSSGYSSSPHREHPLSGPSRPHEGASSPSPSASRRGSDGPREATRPEAAPRTPSTPSTPSTASATHPNTLPDAATVRPRVSSESAKRSGSSGRTRAGERGSRRGSGRSASKAVESE